MEENKTKALEGALIVDEEPNASAEANASDTSEEGADLKADFAADTLFDILDRMDLETDVEIREDDERIVLDVGGEDAGRAIGRKGQTLDALQFLVNKICNRFPTGRRHIIVDSGDYRDRHDRNLVSRATREAKRAIRNGSVVSLEPMNARDRRVVHLSLAKFDGIDTCSEGEGTQRRIQLIPVRSR